MTRPAFAPSTPRRRRSGRSAARAPRTLRFFGALLPRPLGRGRRLPLLGPRLAMPQHGHVRVPAGDRAERERRPRPVAGRHVAGPVRARERDLLLTGTAPLPDCGRAHQDGRTVMPPSTGITAPVTYAPARDAR